MQAEQGIGRDHLIWLRVEDLCRSAIELAESVQTSIREYPGLNFRAGYLSWFLLETLMTQGAVPVSELAALRPASREWIRRLVGELVVGGFAEFLPNPNRRKSKLVRITPRGADRYRAVCSDLDHFAEALKLEPDRIADATIVIQEIHRALLAAMEIRRMHCGPGLVEQGHDAPDDPLP